jgi:hypothetical protein
MAVDAGTKLSLILSIFAGKRDWLTMRLVASGNRHARTGQHALNNHTDDPEALKAKSAPLT